MRTLICHIVPNKFVAKLKAPQASNNFCHGLIDGGVFDKAISIVPPSYYTDGIEDDDDINYLQGHEDSGRLMRRAHCFYDNIKAAWIARKYESIWFYNICASNICAYIMLRFVYHVKVNAILLDYTPEHRKTRIGHYIPWLFLKAHGMISLSKRTNIRHTNMGYKAGIISKDKIKRHKPFEEQRRLTFLFSGNLGNHTGFPLALEVFKKMPECELYISGNGNVDKNDLEKYQNIHYLGYLDYDEYLKLYEKVDVCLSLRNPDYDENNNNFPSKILEYFCYGKIVISTIDYPELNGFKFMKSTYDAKSLCEVVDMLKSMSFDALNILSDNISALAANFSAESWMEMCRKIENKEI